MGPFASFQTCPFSADRKRGQRKGATSRNVKNRQKVSRLFSTLFDIFCAGQNVENCQKCQICFRQFSRGTSFPALLGGSEGSLLHEKRGKLGKCGRQNAEKTENADDWPYDDWRLASEVCKRGWREGVSDSQGQKHTKIVVWDLFPFCCWGIRAKRQKRGRSESLGLEGSSSFF